MRKSVQKGFTIIELVVVIVILGILAAVAFPKFGDLSTQANNAVVQGGIAAVRSAAVIQFAKNNGAKSSAASIIDNTQLEGGVTATVVSGCDVSVASGSSSTTFTISSDYCT